MTLDPRSSHLRPVPRQSLPPEFQSVLTRLEKRFGSSLNVTVTDAKWVEITVEHLPAPMLKLQLEKERQDLFADAEQKVQVIAPLRSTSNAIYLHLLTEPAWTDPQAMRMSGK